MHLKRVITVCLMIVVLCSLASCNIFHNQKDSKPETAYPVEIGWNIKPTLDGPIVPSQIPYYMASAIYQKDAYASETTGETIAKVIINYKQTIKATTYKEGNCAYIYNDSHSTLVDAYLEAYFNDRVQYRESSKADFKDVSYEEYQNEYGIIPTTIQIDGYVINTHSVLSVEKQSRNTFIINLDGEVAGGNNKINMKKLGNLLDYPVYDRLVMIATIDDDFFPITIRVQATYHVRIAVLGRVKCEQDYTISYRELSDEERLVLSSPPKKE